MKYYLYHNDTTRKLLTIELQHRQLEIGTSKTIYETDWKQTSFLATPSSHTYLRTQLESLGITAITPTSNISSGDTIMDKLITSAKKEDITKFNEIQKHLKFFHLNDIMTEPAKTHFLNGNPRNTTETWTRAFYPNVGR